MRAKVLIGLSAALLLAGCSSSNELTSVGQQVTFTDTQPAAKCQRLGEVMGSQSNWLSGVNSEGSSMRGAANDLRNKAAAMGGNVIYGVSSTTQNMLSSFVPLDSNMIGQVYKCP